MTDIKIAVVDYDVGNTFSVYAAVRSLGYTNLCLSRDKAQLASADCLILPGVGAFGSCMAKLKHFDLITLLNEQVLTKKKPILGICVGMQIMADLSFENGEHEGFGWIRGRVIDLKDSISQPVPHVGWNVLSEVSISPLFERLNSRPHFYFDHRYHFVCEGEHQVALVTYEKEITAAVQRQNIYGVQFHPEKSQRDGLRIIKNFIEKVAKC